MEDGQHLKKLERVISYIRHQVDLDMAASQLETFLIVCQHDGIPMPAIQEALGISHTSTSRGIKRLSVFQEGTVIKGYDLVYAKPDLIERRRYAIWLTEKGKKLRDDILKLLSDDDNDNKEEV